MAAHHAGANKVRVARWRLRSAAACSLNAPWLHVSAVSLEPALCPLACLRLGCSLRDKTPVPLLLPAQLDFDFLVFPCFSPRITAGQEGEALSGETAPSEACLRRRWVDECAGGSCGQSFLSTDPRYSQRQHNCYTGKEPCPRLL